MRANDAVALYRRVRARLGWRNELSGRSRWDDQVARIGSALPRAGAVVIDIGSGHEPSPRADVLVDQFPDATVHRTRPVVEDRPLVVCSIERLPFLPGAFDFAICSHVLEHVPRPAAAARELSRIARAGYVETPAYGKDLLVGTGCMHRWQVVEFEATLHFFEYSLRQAEGHSGPSPFMELLLRPDHHAIQDWFKEHDDLLNAWVTWHGTPPSVVEHRRRAQEPPDLLPWQPVAEEHIGRAPCALTIGEQELLTARLATPDGARPMIFEGGRFVDREGGVVYPVRGKRIYCELGP